jgi:hypothetical protein
MEQATQEAPETSSQRVARRKLLRDIWRLANPEKIKAMSRRSHERRREKEAEYASLRNKHRNLTLPDALVISKLKKFVKNKGRTEFSQREIDDYKDVMLFTRAMRDNNFAIVYTWPGRLPSSNRRLLAPTLKQRHSRKACEGKKLCRNCNTLYDVVPEIRKSLCETCYKTRGLRDSRNSIDNLNSGYLRGIAKRQFKTSTIPEAIIAAKRDILSLKRLSDKTSKGKMKCKIK